MSKPFLIPSIAPPKDDGITIHSIDAPLPVGLPAPALWRLYVMPVGMMKKTKGSIILPDDVIDAQLWAHRLCKIAAVGPQVFKGPAYRGLDLKDEDVPKVGDLWLVNPRNPNRIGFAGHNFILINDDQLEAKVDPAFVDKLRFYGFELA